LPLKEDYVDIVAVGLQICAPLPTVIDQLWISTMTTLLFNSRIQAI